MAKTQRAAAKSRKTRTTPSAKARKPRTTPKRPARRAHAHPTARLGKHDWYPDSHIRNILRSVRSIAFVGASTHWKRPSSYAMKYLQKKGFKIIPVNPGRGGAMILGQPVYTSLEDIPEGTDMVDIFRTSEEAGAITDKVIKVAKKKGIRILWMQLGVRDDEAAKRAEAAGLTVIMNRCPKIEYARLSGELSYCGINSRIISGKTLRPPKA